MLEPLKKASRLRKEATAIADDWKLEDDLSM
jgi:hypothetical protein